MKIIIAVIGILVLFWMSVWATKKVIKKADNEKLDVLERNIRSYPVTRQAYNSLCSQLDGIRYRGDRFKKTFAKLEHRFKQVSKYRI
jgi:hypothetical protein